MWVTRWQHDRDTCKDCGRPVAECSDPDRKFYPFRIVCYATMEREAAAAAYSRLHADAPYHNGSWADWSDKQTASHPYGYSDGVKFGVADRDIAPDDRFTTEANAKPAR